MIFKLNKDGYFVITNGQPIEANNSLRNNCIFYINSIVKDMVIDKCDVLFVFADKYKKVYSALLEKTEEQTGNYTKYKIVEENDMSLPIGFYTGYIIIFNPKTNTHISSVTVHFRILEGIDGEFNFIETIDKNVFDTLMAEIHKISNTSSGGTVGGTSNYEELNNLPTINGIELIGAKNLDDLEIAAKNHEHDNYALKETLENYEKNLDDYVSKEDLRNFNYITSEALNGYATEEILGNYVTKEAFENSNHIIDEALNNYIEKDNIDSIITDKLNQETLSTNETLELYNNIKSKISSDVNT